MSQLIINGELCHYGVKGMKWGVRKEYEPVGKKKTSIKQISKTYVDLFKNNKEFRNRELGRIAVSKMMGVFAAELALDLILSDNEKIEIKDWISNFIKYPNYTLKDLFGKKSQDLSKSGIYEPFEFEKFEPLTMEPLKMDPLRVTFDDNFNSEMTRIQSMDLDELLDYMENMGIIRFHE